MSGTVFTSINVISMAVTLALLTFAFLQVPSFQQVITILLSLSTFVVVLGNSIISASSSSDGGQTGLSMLFLGGSFAAFCYLNMYANVCKVTMHTFFQVTMALCNLFYTVIAIHDNMLHFMYRSLSFEEHEGALIYRCEYNWFYYVFLAWILGYFLHMFFCVRQCRKKRPTYYKNLKKTLMLFLICSTLTMVPYMYTVLFHSIYDLTGIGCTLGLVLYYLIIYRTNVYPVSVNAQNIVLNNLDDPLLAITSDAKYEYANERLIEIYPQLLDIPYHYPITQYAPELSDVLSLNNGDTITLSGRIFRDRVIRMGNSSRDAGVIHWLHDITTVTEYMNNLIDLKEEADKANSAKSKFLAHISHEIRTPINAIIGMDEMIIRESKTASVSDYAQQVMRAGKTLLALVNDILDFSKIEAGKMELVETDYNVGNMFDDIITMTKFRAQDKKLTLYTDIADNVPKMLRGDEIRVRQIITNIMTNAVKYTEHGSVTMAVRATVSEDGSCVLTVSVTDTGIGIREADMPKLYASFERIENKTNHMTEGTGLGMSITVQLLKLMNGSIDVKSTYGVGSTFTVTIPQQKSLTSPDKSGDSHSGPSFTAPEARILIVDDNTVNRTIAANLIKPTLVHVETSGSGEEYLKVIKRRFYDLIFLDQRMPGMTGLEAFDISKNSEHLCTNTPVIMMTGDVDEASRKEFAEHGITDFIAKPLDPAEYEAMVGRYLPADKVKH